MKNTKYRLDWIFILALLAALPFVQSISNEASAQTRSTARDRPPTDRVGGTTDRLGANVSRSGTISRAGIDRDDSRFGSDPDRTGSGARFNSNASSPSSRQASRSARTGNTLHGLRNNQASCERHHPNSKRFKGRKQVLQRRCATGRR